MSKTKKCIYCGDPSESIECGNCKTVKKAMKNKGNTSDSRVQQATKHVYNHPGLLKDIYCSEE